MTEGAESEKIAGLFLGGLRILKPGVKLLIICAAPGVGDNRNQSRDQIALDGGWVFFVLSVKPSRSVLARLVFSHRAQSIDQVAPQLPLELRLPFSRRPGKALKRRVENRAESLAKALHVLFIKDWLKMVKRDDHCCQDIKIGFIAEKMDQVKVISQRR